MPYVHYCADCGQHAEEATAALVGPRCRACGGRLAVVAATAWPARRDALAASRPGPVPVRVAMWILLVLGLAPFALLLLGRAGQDLVFLSPVALCLVTAYHCLRAGRAWRLFALAALLSVLASGLIVVGEAGGFGEAPGLYVGTAATIVLAAAGWERLRLATRAAPLERVVDGILWAVAAVAPVAWWVVGDAATHGDPALAAVVAIDLTGLFAAIVALCATSGRDERRLARVVVSGLAAVTGGDSWAFLASAGHVPESPAVVAACWSAALLLLAWAGRGAREARTTPREPGEHAFARRIGMAAIPFGAVLLLAAQGVAAWALAGRSPEPLAVFGALFLAALATVCVRQASLEGRIRRAVLVERRLREEAERRGQELRALTELAATMTERLEEETIVERGLAALALAADADGAELRLDGENSREVTRGDPAAGGTVLELGLRVRTDSLGSVRLARAAGRPFAAAERDLLSVLASQLAAALANARAYRRTLDEAVRDPLTGIHNRRFFDEALDHEIDRAGRSGEPVSVVLFDLDDFKAINDSLGHAAGDEVLCRAVGAVTPLVRAVDRFCRLGGEEFGVVLPGTSALDALLVAERLRTAVARTELAPGRRVTVSGGVASWPDDASTREELLRRADRALYWAKRNGKNLCAVASEATAGEPDEPHALTTNLYSLVAATDGRALHTRDHSENVAAYAVAIGQELGLAPERIHALRRAAFLHDVGKIVVPRAILEKAGPLTAAEWDAMRLHPGVGATMLEHAGLDREAGWVRHHHERMDGAGYPDGLAGEAIPLEARIIFVADSFEAMTSDRPYRAGMAPAEAMAELRRCARTQFDPRVVEAMGRLHDDGRLVVLALRA